jgi:hypothetical protein
LKLVKHGEVLGIMVVCTLFSSSALFDGSRFGFKVFRCSGPCELS